MLLYVFILQQSYVFYPFIHSWKTYLRPAGAEVQKLWTIFCFEALMAVFHSDAPIYIPINSICRVPFVHLLANNCCLSLY